jgi:peptidoglycan/xylan/chitin deacetylase (PgdA/CDA1 family)
MPGSNVSAPARGDADGPPTRRTVELDKGAAVISLDLELLWGTIDLRGERFKRACEVERERVIDDLLDLFVEFEFPGTWCILGHLFLDRCELTNGRMHPQIVRPTHAWVQGDWFDHLHPHSEDRDSLFLGRSLVEKIKTCPEEQEIGSHSFSHVIFGDEGCSRATALSELNECVRLAREMGIQLRSFAFPRDRPGHLDVLRETGFACFRGPEPNWYERPGIPLTVRRLLRLIDVVRAAEPPVVLPEKADAGLWNIPGSAMYFPMHGMRRHIPLSARVTRARRGLDAAARERKIFHLWFHPTNIAFEPDTMLAGLREILEHAARLRDRHQLEFVTMGQLAERLDPALAAH